MFKYAILGVISISTKISTKRNFPNFYFKGMCRLDA